MIMIIILKKQAEEKQVEALKQEMVEQGLLIHESEGENTRILGLIGDTSVVDMRHIMANDIVEKMIGYRSEVQGFDNDTVNRILYQ